MFAINFPNYDRSDSLNSLVTKCVHILCSPVDNLYNKNNKKIASLSPLYDLNIVDRFNHQLKNSEAPIRFIEKLYDHYYNFNKKDNNNENICSKSLLDINSRQLIINYVIRESIFIRANFLKQLLQDGGVHFLDLWRLSDLNKFDNKDIEEIFNSMLKFTSCFHKLSIGGIGWIYHSDIVNGILKQFLCVNNNSRLVNLKELNLQQITNEIDFLQLLKSCPNLKSLKIAEHSLNNQDIFNLVEHFESEPELLSLPVLKSLNCVSFPSSVEEQGIIYFLSYFQQINRLRCTPFEQLLDTINEWKTSSLCSSKKYLLAQKAAQVLQNLKGLSIAHPMSHSMVDRLLQICPKLEELSLELQKNMKLSKLATDAPYLKRLELHNTAANNQSISFNEHVVPILKGCCGKQMKFLSLINFDHIDLTKLAQYCPSLHTLSIQCFITIKFQNQIFRWLGIKKPFSKLKNLRLRPRPTHSLPVEICTLFLQNSLKLRHIELYCCSELTDQVIDQIKQNNDLEQLQTFILRQNGHNVTNQALFKLVSKSISVTNNLVFHDCGLVPPDIKDDDDNQL